MKKLRGCNAILTGASRGLGIHIARALAREGVNLALVARSATALGKVREEILSFNVKAITIPTDLSETEQAETLVGKAESELGPVDILVNNAGVEFTAPYEEYPPGEIKKAVNVNLLAVMLLTHAVLPGMLKRKRGHIVNMSSLAGKIGVPYQTPYSTTKAGLIMFSQTLRSELMDKPVGVSVISPGFVAKDGMYARMKKDIGPSPKLLKPTTTDKVADAVIRSIRKETAELIVNPLPIRPLIMLREAVPGIAPYLHNKIGITNFARELFASRSNSETSV